MQELDDNALLRQFAADRSEAAFTQLVSRHAGFVHSAAMRRVGDPQWAAEITQAVFIILAQKAARISDKTILTGWLFKTTRFVALAQVRAEVKRRRHEQETQMQTRLQTGPSSDAGDPAWAELAPLLDEALAHLGETDRQAVLLRFFENKSLAEVGSKLGAGEDTARKRVSRALEKLRKFFAKHSVCYTTAIIAGAISANAVQPAPEGLVAAIPAMAVKGSAISVSTLALVKEALELMFIAKLKTSAFVAAAAILVAGSALVVNRVVARENQTPNRQTAQLVALPSESQVASNGPVQTDAQRPLSEQEVLELARLRNEAGRLREQIGEMAKAQSDSNSPAMDESVWLINNSIELAALPPSFILRPTQFANIRLGGSGSGGGTVLNRNISFAQLMARAYGADVTRVVPPPGTPTNGFDLLMTGPEATQEKLQAEIKRQLGYVAHFEPRPGDVLLLTLVQAGAPGLQPSTAAPGPGVGGGHGYFGGLDNDSMSMSYQNMSIATLARRLQYSFNKPIVDRSGLSGNYDISFKAAWDSSAVRSNAISQALAAQLGLALTPGSEPMDHLIVEADKEAAQLNPLPTEDQRPSNAVVSASRPGAGSEQPAIEFARLRAEVPRLRLQLDDMAKAQSAANPRGVDPSVWLIQASKDLESVPPAFILRPTQFAHGAGIVSQESQILARRISFAVLMATAFKVDTNKVGCPPGTPTGNFDLLMAGPDSTQEKLQAEIKRQLGYVGHIETRTTDVLLLTLRQADAPGLQPTHSTETRGLVTISGNSLFNVSIPVLVKSYLQPQFQQIILDRSGLTGRYDISFPPGIGILLPPGIGSGKPQSDAITQALTSLGLSLEPGREPLEVLVVEPDKRE